MSEAMYYRNRRAFEAGQSRWDNACPPDDEENEDCAADDSPEEERDNDA